jgi:hypothetical protein
MVGTCRPKAIYNESLEDNNPYEGKLYDSTVSLPDLKDMCTLRTTRGVLRNPFGNNLLAEFAMKAIEKEELGKDEITDFLTVSLLLIM